MSTREHTPFLYTNIITSLLTQQYVVVLNQTSYGNHISNRHNLKMFNNLRWIIIIVVIKH